ncbi:serine/threonine-protein kinase [Flexivirga caeni]|nr:serine/threonine-protein kinase [Flexivirga caeni]
MSAADSPRPVLQGYAVLELLGRGATGAVWAVRGPDEIRLAAKVLGAGADQLDYEPAVLESLRHDHVVRLVDVVADTSTDPCGTAMVMELAEGGSLADTLARREVLTPGELVTLLCPVARALHDLHGLGLIHGDLSPGNILLTGEGKPLIADLGMSRLAGHHGEEVWATETWAAPEVLAGGPPVPASDVYSLGAIAWCALTGAPPEPAALRPDLAELVPDLSPELRDLVNAALAHTDSARPLPGEFAIALWRCARPEPAPVQGSPARRSAVAVPEGDDADALTRRIRAQAAADPDPDGAEQLPRTHRLTWGAAAVVGAAAVGGGIAALAATGLGPGGGDGAAAAARSASGTSGASQAIHTASLATRVSTPTTRATPDRSADLRAAPVRVVQQLAAARAAAWTSGDGARLSAAEVMGSPAHRRDSADLRTAASRGVRYAGLTFTVRSATVRSGSGPAVRVSAVIDNSAYDVVGAGARRTVPAASGQRTELSLQWTNDGWRVVDWAAPH